MFETELNIISPRWISITQAMQYAPALGRKKIVKHIEKGDFDGCLDGGEWVVDRLSMDRYFEKSKKQKEMAVEKGLAKISSIR